MEKIDFDRIYKEYFKQVYAYVLGLCANPALAEELTQETFYKALKNIDKFKGEAKISTWLCQIAKNCYFTHGRKHKKESQWDYDKEYDSPDLFIRLEDKETVLEIHKHLHNMEEPYKEVFTLRIFGELSYLQIAEIFHKTESWARVTFYRSKKMIRAFMEEKNNGKEL